MVLGKVDDGVSFDVVYGKVYEYRQDSCLAASDENSLVNSTDSNHLVTFAVNAIDSVVFLDSLILAPESSLNNFFLLAVLLTRHLFGVLLPLDLRLAAQFIDILRKRFAPARVAQKIADTLMGFVEVRQL